MKLEELSGVGPSRAQQLREAGIDSVSKLSQVEPSQLAQATGLSKKVSERLVVAARESASAPQSVATWKVVLAALVIGFGVFFAVQYFSTPTVIEYNGFTFQEVPCPSEGDDCWQTTVVTNIGARSVIFYHSPTELEDVPVAREAVERFLALTYSRNSSLTIAFDDGAPGSVGVAASQIARVTGERLYNVSTSGAVYGSQVSCADVSELHAVLYVREGSLNGVTTRDGCILLVADSDEELLRVSDAYQLHVLRIMQ